MNQKLTFGAGQPAVRSQNKLDEGASGFRTKTCPRCGAELFADMPICYGCLYDFSRGLATRESEPAAPETRRFDDAGATQALEPASRPTPTPATDRIGDTIPEAGWADAIPLDEAAMPAFPPLEALVEEFDGPWGDYGATWDGPGDPGDGWQEVEWADASACDHYCHEDCYGSASCMGRPAMMSDQSWSSYPPVQGPSAERSPRVWVRGSGADVVTPLTAGGIICGRDPSCDVVLHSQAVSRQHVRLTPLPGGALVEDLGATNPAMLRGRPVHGSARMSYGETLDVCGTLLTLADSS